MSRSPNRRKRSGDPTAFWWRLAPLAHRIRVIGRRISAAHGCEIRWTLGLSRTRNLGLITRAAASGGRRHLLWVEGDSSGALLLLRRRGMRDRAQWPAPPRAR